MIDYYRINTDNKLMHYKYVLDYVQISDIDNLLKLWDFKYKKISYPEQLITTHLFNTFEKGDIAFIGNYLTKDCDIFWISRKLYLSNFVRRPPPGDARYFI